MAQTKGIRLVCLDDPKHTAFSHVVSKREKFVRKQGQDQATSCLVETLFDFYECECGAPAQPVKR